VYIGLEGTGLIVMQDKEGNTRREELRPGRIAYVPKGFAHRSINTGKEKLKFLAVYAGDSGHDYGSIKDEGFKDILKKH
jgi:glucose-6-phosphate isomerase